MSILFISSIIFTLYAIASLALPAAIKPRYKILLSIVFIVCSLKFIIYRYTGSILEPNLDVKTVLALETGHAFLLLCAFLALLKDICSVLLLVIKKLMKVKSTFTLNRFNPYLILCALVMAVSGTLYQLKIPDIKVVEVKIKDLPEELEKLNIIQLTDIHIGPILKHDFLEGVVHRVNEQKADLVLLTGDYVDGSVRSNGKEFKSLASLKSTYGIYAVTGNHEYYSMAREWVEHLKGYNIRFLDNEHVTLNIDGATLTIGGSPDLKAAQFNYTGPDAKKTFKGAPDGTRIYLTHEPATVTMTKVDADLMLSGHTHGGIMFFLKPLIAKYNAGYVSGLYKIDDRLQLYVSNGTGIWSGFSCRILVPSEITLIKLKRAE